ncbi:MAG: DUF3352 domain-containing protein [Solirubrobacteraceae bacterium]|nr:DUF3352 domain-containing protein [Solirubrobacteraceae bacterium]
MTTVTRVRRRRPALALACAGALALGAAACGDSGSGGDAEPASAVPASAPFYAEIAVNPGGDVQSDAEAALRKILGTEDVGAEIERLVKSSGDAPSDEEWEDFKRTKRIGFFFTSLDGQEPQGAAVIAVDGIDDVDLDTDGRQKRTYKDVDYWVDGDGDVTAKVEDFVVAGTEGGLRTVVDTLEGDDVETMDDNDAYDDGLEQLGAEDPLASAYVNVEGLVNAIARSGGLPNDVVGQIREQLEQGTGATSVVAVSANAERIAFGVLGQGTAQGSGAAGDATAALQGLPGGAWLAVGLPGLGESLRTSLQQALQVASAGGEDVAGQMQAIEQALGINVQDDLLSWMGDAGLFAQGTTVADVGGALVVQSTDPATSTAAVGKLRRVIRQAVTGARPRPLTTVSGADAGFEIQTAQLPFPIIVAAAGDRFVVGLGAPAVEAALSPQTTLGDTEAYKTAAGQLEDGVTPGLFVDLSAIGAFAKGLGLDGDAQGAQALQYLDRFGAIIAGSQDEGGTQRSQLVVTLK